MGTINYRMSDYITLGIETISSYDIEQDAELMEDLREMAEEFGTTIQEEIDRYISDYYQDTLCAVQEELDKHAFWAYHVCLLPGYYEGCTIDIESNYGIAYESWEDKRAAQREITEIKGLLLACVDLGLVQVFPGWCTKYASREDTKRAIKAAIREMRQAVRDTPTWAQYYRAEG